MQRQYLPALGKGNSSLEPMWYSVDKPSESPSCTSGLWGEGYAGRMFFIGKRQVKGLRRVGPVVG